MERPKIDKGLLIEDWVKYADYKEKEVEMMKTNRIAATNDYQAQIQALQKENEALQKRVQWWMDKWKLKSDLLNKLQKQVEELKKFVDNVTTISKGVSMGAEYDHVELYKWGKELLNKH